jgi:REP element-mobilizing transposase RayT
MGIREVVRVPFWGSVNPSPLGDGMRSIQCVLKGKSSHELLAEFQVLRKRYWGQHLWSRGYWVASSGNVTDDVWKKYIEDQKPEEPDDNFKVV